MTALSSTPLYLRGRQGRIQKASGAGRHLPQGPVLCQRPGLRRSPDCARSEYGLRVPEDAAVIGFDDIELASYSAYSITSFVQPMDSMIDRVLDLLPSEKQPSNPPT